MSTSPETVATSWKRHGYRSGCDLLRDHPFTSYRQLVDDLEMNAAPLELKVHIEREAAGAVDPIFYVLDDFVRSMAQEMPSGWKPDSEHAQMDVFAQWNASFYPRWRENALTFFDAVCAEAAAGWKPTSGDDPELRQMWRDTARPHGEQA